MYLNTFANTFCRWHRRHLLTQHRSS